MSKLTTAGDTIVEVLIAIAIVSAVIGGAYVSTGHSIRGSLQAQEHSTALKLAESQIEMISAYAKGPNANTLFSNLLLFCMPGPSSGPHSARTGPAGTTSYRQLPPNDTDDLKNNYDVACKNIIATPGLAYYIAVDNNGNNAFIVHIRWDSANSPHHDEVAIAYKVYQ